MSPIEIKKILELAQEYQDRDEEFIFIDPKKLVHIILKLVSAEARCQELVNE